MSNSTNVNDTMIEDNKDGNISPSDLRKIPTSSTNRGTDIKGMPMVLSEGESRLSSFNPNTTDAKQ